MKIIFFIYLYLSYLDFRIFTFHSSNLLQDFKPKHSCQEPLTLSEIDKIVKLNEEFKRKAEKIYQKTEN